MWSVSIFGKFLVPPLGNDKFSFELYTRLHCFKYEFSKIFWGWAHRALSLDSFPRSISGFAFDSGFDLKSRAVRAIAGWALPSIHTNMFDHSPNRGELDKIFWPSTSTSWLRYTVVYILIYRLSYIDGRPGPPNISDKSAPMPVGIDTISLGSRKPTPLGVQVRPVTISQNKCKATIKHCVPDVSLFIDPELKSPFWYVSA